jgi:hypothetical protein
MYPNLCRLDYRMPNKNRPPSLGKYLAANRRNRCDAIHIGNSKLASLTDEPKKEAERLGGPSGLWVGYRGAVVRVPMSRRIKTDLPPTLTHDRYIRVFGMQIQEQ